MSRPAGRVLWMRVAWMLRVVSLVLEVGLLLTGFSVISSDAQNDLLGMVVWDLLAFLYLVVGLLGVWLVPHIQGERAGRDAARAEPPRRSRFVARLLGLYWGFMPVAFSLLGLSAALSVLLMGTSGDHGIDLAMKGSGAVAMTAAWILLHVSYARRYRWIYERLGGGLEFPGEAQAPTAVDFLYFSMTMGASFATSDVNVTHTRMRAHVIVHSVLSFFYNAVVLAVAFRILTGG